MYRVTITAMLLMASATALVNGQARQGGGPPAAADAQAAAPIDLTGYWVSIVNEDWRWRMVTPPKGDFPGLPLNAEGRRVAAAWDETTDGSCLAYGAGGIMRMPGRLHITWESGNTLRVDTDAGAQTRRFLFSTSGASSPREKSLQGHSAAEWERAGRRGAGGGAAGLVGPGAGSPGGNLRVVTTSLSGGWVRRNGVPYSDGATVVEYFDRFAARDGGEWLVVTTILKDPRYWTGDFITSSHFRREPDGSRWDPQPCRN